MRCKFIYFTVQEQRTRSLQGHHSASVQFKKKNTWEVHYSVKCVSNFHLAAIIATFIWIHLQLLCSSTLLIKVTRLTRTNLGLLTSKVYRSPSSFILKLTLGPSTELLVSENEQSSSNCCQLNMSGPTWCSRYMTETPGMPSGVWIIIPDRRRRNEKARNFKVPKVASGEGLTSLLSNTNCLSRGTWKGAHLPGTLKDGRRRALKTECLSLCESSMRETWWEGSFTEDPEG
jgi:hypothetical protein